MSILDCHIETSQFVDGLGDSGLTRISQSRLGQAVVDVHGGFQGAIGHSKLLATVSLAGVETSIDQGESDLLGQGPEQGPLMVGRNLFRTHYQPTNRSPRCLH